MNSKHALRGLPNKKEMKKELSRAISQIVHGEHSYSDLLARRFYSKFPSDRTLHQIDRQESTSLREKLIKAIALIALVGFDDTISGVNSTNGDTKKTDILSHLK